MSSTAVRPREPVVLVFAGQGSQHSRMAAGLYQHDEVFTAWMDEAFRLFRNGDELREIWLDPLPPAEFDSAPTAQPLLYAVNHALGRMVLSRGVEPVAVLGHSVGEFAAATLAGVLSFEDGVDLMQERMAGFADSPGGSMVAVAASADQLTGLFDQHEVYLAAVNGPRQIFIAGERGPLDAAVEWLEERQIICRDILCGIAFHSPVVNTATAVSLPAFRRVTFRPPTIPMYSAYTKGRLDDRDATDPRFWAWQAARPVYFGPTLELLLNHLDCLILEAGPGTSLSMLARRQPRIRKGFSRTRALLPDHSEGDEADLRSVAETFSALGLPEPVAAGSHPGGGEQG